MFKLLHNVKMSEQHMTHYVTCYNPPQLDVELSSLIQLLRHSQVRSSMEPPAALTATANMDYPH